MIDATAITIASFVLGCLAVGLNLYVWSKPATSTQPAPYDAATIGPDGYMKVWESGGRINMRFRNMPSVTVKFDCSVAGDLAAWLENRTTQPK